MLLAKFRKATKCLLPELQTLTSVAQIHALNDNWFQLQNDWNQLDKEDKAEVQDYFNIIGNGFGDFMFNGEKRKVED